MAFEPGPAMATRRSGCVTVALYEHRIMVAGGNSGSGYLNTTEVLDVRTMAFAPGPSMASARSWCAAAAVDAQHVLVIGGLDSLGTSLASTELLDVAMMEFAPGPNMRAARLACAAVRFDAADGQPRILVIGDGETEVLAAAADGPNPPAAQRRA